MKTANTIEVTIPVTVSYLKKLIKDADAKIKDNDAFDLFINSDKFKKALGKDLLNTWKSVNDDSDPSDIVDFFEDQIEFPDEDFED